MKNRLLMNAVITFIAILLLCSDAFGQSTDTLNYDFNFNIGGQRKRGVFSQTVLRATANTKLENKKFVINNQSSYTYTEANDFNIANDWHFRTIGTLKLNSTSRIFPIIGHNYFKNVLYRITNSHRALTGVKLIPIKDYQSFSIVLGAGYEFSQYTSEVFVNSPLVSNQRDFTIGFFNLSGKQQIRKSKVLFDYNLSYVQSFEEADDFSFWLTSGLSVPVGRHLFLGLDYDFRFRNVHLIDLPNINDLLIFSLRFNIAN